MGCRAACKVSYYHRIPRGGRSETWPPLIGGSRRRDKLLRPYHARLGQRALRRSRVGPLRLPIITNSAIQGSDSRRCSPARGEAELHHKRRCIPPPIDRKSTRLNSSHLVIS